MRSGLLLGMVAVLIGGGCQSVPNQTAGSVYQAESAVFSSHSSDLAGALAVFLQGRLLEAESGIGSEAATDAYRRALSLRPDVHAIYARLALHAFYLQDPDEAIAWLQASYQADPSDYVRSMDLASMYHLTGRKQDAIQRYSASLELVHTNASVYVVLSNLLFEEDRDVEALAMLQQGFTSLPDPAPLTAYLYETARRFVGRTQWERARACFALLADWHAEDAAQIQYLIGELYIAQERFPEAQASLQQAIHQPGAPAAAFLQLGVLLFEQTATNQALAVLQQGADRFPQQAAFPFALGNIYTALDQHTQALPAYQQAVELATATKTASEEPDRHELERMLIALASTQSRLGAMDETEETLRRTLEQYPHSHVAMNFLAYMWAEAGENLEEAYELSRSSLALEPENGAYLDTLGWILYRQGAHTQALGYLQRAQRVLDNDPEITLHVGDVQHALGNTEQAISYWKQSLQADPRPENRAWQQLVATGHTPQEFLDPAATPLPSEHGTTNQVETAAPPDVPRPPAAKPAPAPSLEAP